MAHAKVSRLQETPKSDQQLGTLIAAVLNHPDLPEGVYNSIGDALAELQSQPGHGTRPATIQAVIDATKGKAAEPRAAEGDDIQPDPGDEPTLQLTMDQFRQLEEVWYAIGELSDMVAAPGNENGGLVCLKLVDHSMAEVMHDLQTQVEKGGGA